jgi:2-octaprenylphenol hydroxylase
MSRQQEVDILIVGGGMAGGFLAAALAPANLSVCLLDGTPTPVFPTGDPMLRVSALTEASQHMLLHTGVWQRLDSQRLAPWQQMEVFDSDGTGRVDFSAASVAAPALGWIVENQHLVAAIHATLKQQAGVEWRSNSRVEHVERNESGWQVRLAEGDVIQCRLLAGADGARSLVREAAGINCGHRDTGHQALVTWLTTEKPHGNCARQWFMASGPLAFLPLFGGDGHQVSIVWSATPGRADELMGLSTAEFSETLRRASDGVLGEVKPMASPVRFPIHELHAANYVGVRLALLGDAAHVVHPLAGQGINLGLLDGGVLAEEICRAQARGLPLGEASTLARYQRRRRGHNLVMQQSLRGFQLLFAQQQPAWRWLRNAGMKLVNGATPLKQQIIAEAMGRHGDLPDIARSAS